MSAPVTRRPGTRSGVLPTALPAAAPPTAPGPPDAAPTPGTGGGHRPSPDPASRPRGIVRRLNSPAVRSRCGTVAGLAILAVLLWRLGTGVFVDGVRRIDGPSLAAALVVGLATTVLSAWRWSTVARGLRIRLPLGAAVADYYRALFLNAALPGGVLGDVHRAVRHGKDAGNLGGAVRAVVLERTAGQAVLAVVGGAVLVGLPSPVATEVRHVAVPAVCLAALVAALVLARRGSRPPVTRRGRALRSALAEARAGLLSRGAWPAVLLSSVLVLAGHLAMFMVAARVAGCSASTATLLPLAVLALVAMGLPLNVGGWGPREGVTAWAFGAAGLGAETGLAVAVAYGVLSMAASLPGAAVLVVRRRGRQPIDTPTTLPCTGVAAERVATRVRRGRYPRRSVSSVGAGARSAVAPRACGTAGSEVSRVKYAPNESTRLASSARPFSAVPRDGRPTTPDPV